MQGKVESSEVGLYLLGWRQVIRTPVCCEESYALGWRRGAMRGLKARGWHGQLCILGFQATGRRREREIDLEGQCGGPRGTDKGSC